MREGGLEKRQKDRGERKYGVAGGLCSTVRERVDRGKKKEGEGGSRKEGEKN